MEANYVHKDSTTLIQDKLVKNELNQIELQYNALKQQKFNELLKENKELEKQLEEINKVIEKCGFVNIEQVMLNYCGFLTQQKEFISYLENEKDRLARECSQIYEDSLGKTRYVNEDIFNEVDTILSKYKSIIGVSNENNIK